jgi:hypothetical protein
LYIPDPDNSVLDDSWENRQGKLLSTTSEFILAVLDKNEIIVSVHAGIEWKILR